MRKILLIGIFINYSLYSLAQGNLVPNYSLEVYDTCPNSGGTCCGEIFYSFPWFQPCTYLGNTTNSSSSDYFNACDTTQSAGVPSNGSIGYQYAKTGVAYAGIIMYNGYGVFPSNFNYREYIEVKLNSQLIQNATYCVSFYVSRADYMRYGINTIGCLFTVDSFLTDSFNQEIFLIPQVENTQGIITDTMNWVLISGGFTANGGEQFLTIGNFKNDSNTSVVDASGGVFQEYAYYYIDDVSVTLCDTTAVEEFQNEDYRLQIYPNPTGGSVTITAKGGDEIIITDIAGRKIKEYKLLNNQLKINIDEYDNGIYFLTLYNKLQFIATDKLIVAK